MSNPKSKDTNPDPITGEPGSHPIGTGVGAAGAGAAGIAIGAVAGPVGAAVGGLIGVIAGAAAGHEVAERIDPTEEAAYWEENFQGQPFYEEGEEFADYAPAYEFGYGRYHEFQGRSNEEAEKELGREWEEKRGSSRLSWDKAKLAARAGWARVKAKFDGDPVT